MQDAKPLILTLALDDRSFAVLDGLRRRHFPPERNVIPAHLTLFHHLPGEREAEVMGDVAALCRARSPFTLAVTGPRSLGRGVALALESAALVALRRELAERWRDHLTPQDRQGFRPHVTVQNKVEPEAARRLLDALQATWEPFTAEATGLALWRYLGGPWERRALIPFTGPYQGGAPGA